MKHLLIALLAITLIGGCKKENSTSGTDDNTNTQSTMTAAKTGWIVTLFRIDDNDRTSNFAGFKFLFYQDGHVSAANDLFAVNGTWSISSGGDAKKFVVNFPEMGGFNILSGTWYVKTDSADKLVLENTAQNTADTDYLTFTKYQ